MSFHCFVVSGFYAECPSKKVCFNAHIWTKSKFYGMSIGVVNQGEGKQVNEKKLDSRRLVKEEIWP